MNIMSLCDFAQNNTTLEEIISLFVFGGTQKKVNTPAKVVVTRSLSSEYVPAEFVYGPANISTT